MSYLSLLRSLHRYAALIFTPIFIVLLLSGMILAFKPILAPQFSEAPFGEHAPALATAVADLAREGASIQSLYLDAGGKDFWIDDGKRMQRHSLADGQHLGSAGMNMALYQSMKELHKELWLDADVLVEWATYVMLFLLVIGFFLQKVRWRKNLMAWHNGVGTYIVPLLALLPVTGLLMTVHFGAPDFSDVQKASLSVPEMVLHLDQQGILPQLQSIESIKGGRYRSLHLVSSEGVKTWQMDASGVLHPLELKTYWVKALHEGTWAGALSGVLNFLLACALLFLCLSGAYTWGKRYWAQQQAKRQSAETVGATDILVAYASQTGRAKALAEATTETLTRLLPPSRSVHLRSLAGVQAHELQNYQHCFLLCSTTGEGELPDAARHLHTELRRGSFPRIHYSLFALGDRAYTHFCGGGHRLHDALQAAGAQEELKLAEADGEPSAAWQTWMHNITQLLGFAMDAPAAPKLAQREHPLRLCLKRRQRLDDPSYQQREVWMLEWQIVDKNPQAFDFRGGDLLLITPPDETRPRSYSIGSDALQGSVLRLTVGRNLFKAEDGSMRSGRCSRYLLDELKEGDEIQALWREHPNFRLHDDSRPAILIAVGTGIAPLIGFLPRLQQTPRPTWLFYGNSHRLANNFYGECWDEALAQGVLSRIDRVFDEEQRGYVQDLVLTHAQELTRWIEHDRAVIYICGRASTLGRGFEDTTLAFKLNRVHD